MLVKAFSRIGTNVDAVSWVGLSSNLVPVILGNLIGGSVFVGFVYYVIYLRARPE
jgi:formate/nitrite transporter FocA (FNT family)